MNTTKIAAGRFTTHLLLAGLGVGAVMSLDFTGAPQASATSIIRSKSNITNNRTSGDPHLYADGRTVGGGTGAPTAIKRYPPHGYPCLGCHPCPPSFCDNDNNMVVWTDPTGGTLVAWFTAHATA